MPHSLDSYILAIQNGAEACAANTWMGFEPATRGQVDRLRITLENCDPAGGRLPRAERLALLRRVYPVSHLPGLALRQLESTRDLSKAQACALIDALYGHPAGGLRAGTPLSPDGAWFLGELLARVRTEAHQVEAAFAGVLVAA